MAIATTGKDVLAKFFDEGAYSALYADGAVTAAFGSANGTPVYAVCQTGAAVAEKDTEKVVKVLDMAAKTGNPVVTFYNSVGAKLEEGLAALSGSAAVAAAVAKVSGVVPQIAVVTGVCGALRSGRCRCRCVHCKQGGRAVFDGSVYLCRRRR